MLAAVAVGVSAWAAGKMAMTLWGPLASGTLQVAKLMLDLVSNDVVCSPAAFRLGVGSFVVTISPECSGYEGIGLLWVFLAAYIWFYRAELRFPHTLLMIPLGTAAIWLANAARIAALILIGAWFSPDLAAGGFHSQAGWLAFNGVALGIVLLTRHLPWFAATNAPAKDDVVQVNPSAEYLVPLLVLVAATMVGTALTVGFDATYPLRVLATGAALWVFRRRYAAMSWSFSWTSVAIGVVTFVVWMALEPAPADTGEVISSTWCGCPGGWPWPGWRSASWGRSSRCRWPRSWRSGAT